MDVWHLLALIFFVRGNVNTAGPHISCKTHFGAVIFVSRPPACLPTTALALHSIAQRLRGIQKGEPALILWMPNPGFIPKPFDVSEFCSHFCHRREGHTLEFDVSFEIRPLLMVGKVVNRA